MDDSEKQMRINNANALHQAIRVLDEEIDKLLMPVFLDAQTATAEEIKKLIMEFPSGAHRTDLRALLIKKERQCSP
jgi:hypothetical protein